MNSPTGSGSSYEIAPIDINVDANYEFYMTFLIEASDSADSVIAA